MASYTGSLQTTRSRRRDIEEERMQAEARRSLMPRTVPASRIGAGPGGGGPSLPARRQIRSSGSEPEPLSRRTTPSTPPCSGGSLTTRGHVHAPAARSKGGCHNSSCRSTRPQQQPQYAIEGDDSVLAFLESMRMLQHAEVLIANGFDDMEALMEIRESDMWDLGLPRGHILKLLKKLRELGARGEPQAPPAEAPVEAAPSLASRVVAKPTPQMASAVQQSWAEVQKLGSDAVGDLLYKNLFTLAPQAVILFPLHVRERYQHWLVDESSVSIELSPALRNLFGKILAAVGYAVQHVQDIESLKPAMMALGARHFGYACQAAHYQVLQKALIQTLEAALGDIWTPEVEFAWTVVYGFMSSIMLDGQQEADQIRQAAEVASRKLKPSIDIDVTSNLNNVDIMDPDDTDVNLTDSHYTPATATSMALVSSTPTLLRNRHAATQDLAAAKRLGDRPPRANIQTYR